MSQYKLVSLAENHPRVRWNSQDGSMAITPIEHQFTFHSTSPDTALSDARRMLSNYAMKLAETLDQGEIYLITYRPWVVEGGSGYTDGVKVIALTSMVTDVRTRRAGLTLHS